MLDVRDVHLHYGAAQALRGVSLAVRLGQVTCLMGRNGVGKTSLLRAVMGLHPISKGEIVWRDSPLGASPPFERARKGIAMVPQGREIFPLLTVGENLQTGFAGLPAADRHVPEDVFELFPILSQMMHRRGGDLSGGQQQQLAIGRAMVRRPKLLLLDEPTEGIQPSIIIQIGNAIDYLRKRGDMAILLVEQYFEFARDLADTFAVMERGEIVMAGERSEMDEDRIRANMSV